MGRRRNISAIASWTGLSCGPFALAGAFASPTAGLAAGAGVSLLALIGWARGENAGVAGVAVLLGVAALIAANPAFFVIPVIVAGGFAARALWRALARLWSSHHEGVIPHA